MLKVEQHEAPYERLEVYQKAYAVALEVHRETLRFPRIEQFELASQLRRAAKSIVVNIVEGMGRQSSPAEVQRYIRMAMGSCDESRIWLKFARDLGYLGDPVHRELADRYVEIGRMLRGLIHRYQSEEPKKSHSKQSVDARNGQGR